MDSDYSGTIDSHEMRNALREAGEYAVQGHRRITAVPPSNIGGTVEPLMALLPSRLLDHSVASAILPS